MLQSNLFSKNRREMTEPIIELGEEGESKKEFLGRDDDDFDWSSSSSPAVFTSTEGRRTSALPLHASNATFTDNSSTSKQKGSMRRMKKLIKTTNKTSPLQFNPKPPKPPTRESIFIDDPSNSRKTSMWQLSEPRQPQLVTDESEDAVLASVEDRSVNTKTGVDGFRPAVPGEKPPLNVPSLGNAFQRPGAKRNYSSGLESITQKVWDMQRSGSFTNRGRDHSKHRRAKTLLTSMEGGLRRRGSGDYFGIAADDDHFREFDKIYDYNITKNESGEKESTNVETSGNSDNGTDYDDEPLYGETLPLLTRDNFGNKKVSERQLKARNVLKKSHWKRIRELLNPLRMVKNLGQYIVDSTLFVSLSFFTTAWILYYDGGDPPSPDFLPGTSRLSWWCNFAGRWNWYILSIEFCQCSYVLLLLKGRQMLVFELARILQFLFIDCFLLAFRFVSHAIGPWVTIFCLQVR
jgi:hypothetical protein